MDRAQSCLEVDLCKVIAELAGLDLEQPEQAAKVVGVAGRAQWQLGVARRPVGCDRDPRSAVTSPGWGQLTDSC